MPRQLDFRVHAGTDSDVLVLHDTAGGRISIVIEQSSGIGVEAILTSDQAAQLVEDLQRELECGLSKTTSACGCQCTTKAADGLVVQ